MTDEERRNEIDHKCSNVKMVTSYLFILLQTNLQHIAIPHPSRLPPCHLKVNWPKAKRGWPGPSPRGKVFIVHHRPPITIDFPAPKPKTHVIARSVQNGDPAKAIGLCGERRSQGTGGIFRSAGNVTLWLVLRRRGNPHPLPPKAAHGFAMQRKRIPAVTSFPRNDVVWGLFCAFYQTCTKIAVCTCASTQSPGKSWGYR